VQAVKVDNPGIGDDGATRFAAIAANWYCPEQLGAQ
jgi:rubredoxin